MAETEEVKEDAKVVIEEPLKEPLKEPPKEPYEKLVGDSITAFFRKRSKDQGKYGFTAEGDLEIKDPAGTIQLKRFLPLEPSERALLEELRLDTLADLDGQYADEVVKLSTAWKEYHATGAMRPVMTANQRVAELDVRRNAVRSAVRNIVSIPNPTTNQILLSDRYEERKLFGFKDPFDKEVYRLSFYEFKPEYDQGKYVVDKDTKSALQSLEEEASGTDPSELTFRQNLKDGRKARIFFETTSTVNGFLSPMWPVEFTMDETRYFTAIQAYEAERARELGLTDLRASILKSRSARTIRLMTLKITQHPADAKGLWLKIFTQIYQQTETLKEKLLATGTDALVYADNRKGPSGIGLTEKDSGVLDPSKWTGENAVGLAQETVRTQMREGALTEAPVNAAPKESVITEKEQANAKVAAIINHARNAKPPG